MKTEMVTFPSNGATGSGYLAAPDDGRPHPGVVVIQEWWGLDDHIKDVTRRFAQEGFVALAPDLYHGKVTAEPDEAAKLMMALRQEEAAKDMRGAVAYLNSRNDVQPKKIGMTGFCMGGGLTMYMAVHYPDGLGAVAPFYGTIIPSEEEAANLKVPILAIFGEKDDYTPHDKIEALRRGLDRSSVAHEVIVYPGAPHAFFNDTRESYRPEAAKDAWGRVLAFFRQHLSA